MDSTLAALHEFVIARAHPSNTRGNINSERNGYHAKNNLIEKALTNLVPRLSVIFLLLSLLEVEADSERETGKRLGPLWILPHTHQTHTVLFKSMHST